MKQVNEWSLPSNDGWSNITFETRALHRKDCLLECCVYLTGRHECAVGQSAVPCNSDRVLDDYIIRLPTVSVSVSACDQLILDFDRWVGSSTPFNRCLTLTSEQVVTLEVGNRTDLITTTDHPAVTFCYDGGKCRLEAFFVVDQSCIRLAREELAATLAVFTRHRERQF